MLRGVELGCAENRVRFLGGASSAPHKSPSIDPPSSFRMMMRPERAAASVSLGALRPQESSLNGHGHGARAVGSVQLEQNVRDMGLDGRFAQGEFGRDLLVGLALGDES